MRLEDTKEKKVYELRVGSDVQPVHVSKVGENGNEYIETRKEKILGYATNLAKIAKEQLDKDTTDYVRLTAIKHDERSTLLNVLAKVTQLAEMDHRKIVSNFGTKVIENHSRKHKTATVFYTDIRYE